MALFGGVLALAPVCQPDYGLEGDSLENIPVQGTVLPEGNFTGHLTIASLAFHDDEALVTGVLDGTVVDKEGAGERVVVQPFRVPARLVDLGQTTDVILLEMASIPIASLGLQVKLAQITLDIYTISSDEDLLTGPPNRHPMTGGQWTSFAVRRQPPRGGSA
jgi:hypothetical protein